MRRLSLSTKLLAAALPLVVAVGALLAVTVRSDLSDVARAENGAELGAVWDPLITALTAIEREVDSAGVLDAARDTVASSNADDRRATDQAINDLRAAIEPLGAADAAGEHITASRSALSAARRNLDMAQLAPEMQLEVDPVDAYDIASREVVAVGQLLPSEAGDPALGRELLAVVKLAEAKIAANNVIANTQRWPNPTADRAPLEQARSAIAELQAVLGEFEAIAPDEWATQYRRSGFTTAIAGYRAELDRVGRAAAAGQVQTFDTAGFAELVDRGVEFQALISEAIVERATTDADETRRSVLIRIAVILGAVLLAFLIAWAIIRSVTRRVRAVADGANQVATEQLPALVEALRDPRGKSVLPDIAPVPAKGRDELTELAQAFNSMQGTLVEVAHEQVEVLRRGVSDIFVTMARRNRSLIDRQLAMLDEFEAEVDDPDVLANYYQLDHLSTRMRRNSESLLVLANAEPKRRRVKATEIDDVVRASIGEVEDYRRIEIEALESLQVRGNVVADVSHLLAELLDNATSFSPPDSAVRVGGRRAGDSYLLRIVDDGVGIPTERLRQLNELLREPPIVGLSAASTLGMSVVSLLANKHDIQVTLSAGNPGLTVDVVLPSSLFGPIEEPFGGGMPVSVPAGASAGAAVDDEPQLVQWGDQLQTAFDAGALSDETFQPADTIPAVDPFPPASSDGERPPPEPRPVAPMFADDDAPRVVQGDWTKMSLDLAAFKTGQQSAGPDADTQEPEAAPAVDPVTVDRVDPVTIDPVSIDPVSIDPVSIDPVSIDPVTIDPVTIDPVTIDPVTVDPDPLEPADPLPALGPPVGATPLMPDLPPPGAVGRVHGEFDVPPAPPISTDGLSRRPVSPDTARRAPDPTAGEALPSVNLPTRSPGRAAGTDEPDRLAGTAAAADEPSALSAALAAFDNPYSGSQPDDLPTRARVGDPLEAIEEPASISQSRIDPDALRERLRAFQSEFSTGLGSAATGSDSPDHQNTDLGGDRR